LEAWTKTSRESAQLSFFHPMIEATQLKLPSETKKARAHCDCVSRNDKDNYSRHYQKDEGPNTRANEFSHISDQAHTYQEKNTYQCTNVTIHSPSWHKVSPFIRRFIYHFFKALSSLFTVASSFLNSSSISFKPMIWACCCSICDFILTWLLSGISRVKLHFR